MTDNAEQLPPEPVESTGIQDAFANALERYQAAFGSQDIDEAEGAIDDIFALAEAFADENPSEDLKLMLQASDCEERGDWVGAEAAYRALLDLPNVDPLGIHRAHVSLYSHFKLLGRDADAFEHARLASLAARQTDFGIIKTLSLWRDARCALDRGELPVAESAIAEAFTIVDQDKVANQLRAKLLIVRAETAVARGRLSAAETDLQEAMELLHPMSAMAMAGGIHSDLADGWSVTSRVRAARSDMCGAVEAAAKAVAAHRHLAALPHLAGVHTRVALAAALKNLADALNADGLRQEAQAALQEHDAIIDEAKIPRP